MSYYQYLLIFVIYVLSIINLNSFAVNGLDTERTIRHEWKRRPDLPYQLSDMAISASEDGHFIVITGGCSGEQIYMGGFYGCTEVTDKALIHFPETHEYVETPLMPRPRARHTSAMIGDKLYLIGGREADDFNITKEIDVLDLSNLDNPVWETLNSTFDAALSDQTSFIFDGLVYVAGGWSANYSFVSEKTYRLDMDSETFEELGEQSNLNIPRGDCIATTLQNRGYLFGGFKIAEDGTSVPLASLEIFNPVTLQWTEVQDSSNNPRGDKAIAALNGKIYIFGGEDKEEGERSLPVREVEVFIPRHDLEKSTWNFAGELPSRRFRFNAAVWRDSVFLYGGQGARIGEFETAGSSYPILSRVDQFTEFQGGPDDMTVIPLHGSGTTNPSKWIWRALSLLEIEARVPIHATYRAVGSGFGQSEFIGESPEHPDDSEYSARTHFGCGDLPMTKARYDALLNAGHQMIHFPFALSMIGVFYNFPNDVIQDNELKMVPCTLAKVFSREIKTWDHPEIVEENPWIRDKVPSDTPIEVAHRVHGSSSTSGITEYLKKACPDHWKLGAGSTIDWPQGTSPVQGSGNMARKLKSTHYTIGYLDAGHGHSENLQELELQNLDGEFVNTISSDLEKSIDESLVNSIFPAQGTDDFSNVEFLNLPGKETWPIVVVSYFYVRRDLSGLGSTASLLYHLLEFSISDKGQELLSDYLFVPVPSAIVERNRAALTQLRLPFDAPEFKVETLEDVSDDGPELFTLSGKRNTYTSLEISEIRGRLQTIETQYLELLNAKTGSQSPSSIAIAAFVISLLCLFLVLGYILYKTPRGKVKYDSPSDPKIANPNDDNESLGRVDSLQMETA